MFRDAHHYFNHISKNYEAYSESAKRLGDSIILSSEELFSVLRATSKKQYGVYQPSLLPPKAKIEMAVLIHDMYNATNSQIQRLLKLPIETVNDLFPMRAKK